MLHMSVYCFPMTITTSVGYRPVNISSIIDSINLSIIDNSLTVNAVKLFNHTTNNNTLQIFINLLQHKLNYRRNVNENIHTFYL